MPHPYRNANLPVSDRVANLLSLMTVEEKVGQCNLVPARADTVEQVLQGARVGRVGAMILASSAFAGSEEQAVATIQQYNAVARAAVEESRLGIPVMNGRDVIHGHRTVFPIPLAQAAAFDSDLVEECAAVAAREARSQGVHWTFAPMIDIARDARWGRIVEGFGEDPYLASVLAAAMVHGFQGRETGELASPERVLACAKHYVGYGAAEGGRDYNTAEIGEHTLRNVYLPPFAAAVRAGVGSVMSAFMDLNGEPASGSPYLLTEILRGELGFQGFVVSDWDSVAELVQHGVCEDKRAAAALAFGAGVDMDMCSDTYIEHLAERVTSGAVSQGRLDAAVGAILMAKFRLGLFENPYTDEAGTSREQRRPEHLALARRAAARTLVLLKNDGALLPLPRTGPRIALVGPMIDARRALLGSWTLDGRESETPSIAEAMREAAPEARIRMSAGMEDVSFAVQHSDVAVVIVGESHSRTGENSNVADIRLPHGQEELIREVTALGKPVVVVVCAGRPVVLADAVRGAQAIVYAWHGGSMAAHAVADVLFGDVNPSAKLPVSLPRATGQIPIHYNHKPRGRQFEGAAWYRDVAATPEFPFGFGLSYTTFEYENLTVSAPAIGAGQTVEVAVTVRNTGGRAGEEVAQCYLRDCVARRTRPVRELRGFRRVALEAGDSARIAFTLGEAELGYYGPEGRCCVEPGLFRVWVGGDSGATLAGEFRYEG